MYEYRVKRGDTLSSISRAVYRDAGQAPMIAKFNHLPDANLILIGQKLRLPPTNARTGAPTLGVIGEHKEVWGFTPLQRWFPHHH
jgi:LysM repeat protein